MYACTYVCVSFLMFTIDPQTLLKIDPQTLLKIGPQTLLDAKTYLLITFFIDKDIKNCIVTVSNKTKPYFLATIVFYSLDSCLLVYSKQFETLLSTYVEF